jgi:hypothetical protein
MDNVQFDEKKVNEELEKIKELIKKNEVRFGKLSGKKTKSEYESIYEDIMHILVYLGKLSKADDMKDVRDMYEMASRLEHPKNPKKAMKLFLTNYTNHTEKFDSLKERCWKIIDKTAPVVYR